MSARSRFAVCLSLGVWIYSCPPATASARPSTTVKSPQVVVLKLSDLRSAYLLRAGYVHYDEGATSPQEINLQIQRHFNVVLGILAVSTPRSIETALDRLETAAGRSWSADERNQWRKQLKINRYVQMMRLTAYRDRGLFPQNEGVSELPVPIFVDRYDTACAVGHLMRRSGWESSTADIASTNNLVYVPDAERSVLPLWTLTSGLTIEEAALIQPGYPLITPLLFTDYGPGGAVLDNNGLRYRNFVMESQNYDINENPNNYPDVICNSAPELCAPEYEPTPFGPHPNPENLGINVGATENFEDTDYYGQPYPQFVGLDPVGTNWMVIGGSSDPDVIYGSTPESDRFLEASYFIPDGAQSIIVRFDVSALDPRGRLDEITQSSFLLHGGFPTADYYYYEAFFMKTRVLSEGQEVASAFFESSEDYPLNARASSAFAGLRNATVETEIWLQNAYISSFVLDFHVTEIPEPASGLLFAAGGSLVGVVARRRRRSFENPRTRYERRPAI